MSKNQNYEISKLEALIRQSMDQLKAEEEGEPLINTEAFQEDFGEMLAHEMSNLDERQAVLESDFYKKMQEVYTQFTTQMYTLFLLRNALLDAHKKTITGDEFNALCKQIEHQEEQEFREGRLQLNPELVLKFYEGDWGQDALSDSNSSASKGPAGLSSSFRRRKKML